MKEGGTGPGGGTLLKKEEWCPQGALPRTHPGTGSGLRSNTAGAELQEWEQGNEAEGHIVAGRDKA